MPSIVKFIEIENRMVVSTDWGEMVMGSYSLVDMELHFCKMKSSGDGWRWYSNMYMLNAIELNN